MVMSFGRGTSSETGSQGVDVSAERTRQNRLGRSAGHYVDTEGGVRTYREDAA